MALLSGYISIDRPIIPRPVVWLLASSIEQLTSIALRVCLWVLVLAALVDPGDKSIHGKAPIFICVLVIWLFRKGLTNSAFFRWQLLAVIIAAIVLPWLWGDLGYISGGVRDLANLGGALKSYAFIFLFFVITDENLPLDLIIAKSGFIVAVLVLAVCALYFVSPILYAGVYQFTLDKDLALLNAERDLFGLGVGSFYYKTSAVLVFSLGYSLQGVLWGGGRRWVRCFGAFVSGAAIVASGARGNILGAIVVVGFLCLRKTYERFGQKTALAFGIALLALFMALTAKRFFDPQEASNQVKLQHFSSYLVEFAEHPQILVWGQGVGTSFYSAGSERYTSNTELTYMELLRQYGIPAALVIGGFLLLPVFLVIRRGATKYLNTFLIPAYLGYLLTAGTNPLLISSTGSSYWSQCKRNSFTR